MQRFAGVELLVGLSIHVQRQPLTRSSMAGGRGYLDLRDSDTVCIC